MPAHGTYAGYVSGCRCAGCKAGAAAYARARRAGIGPTADTRTARQAAALFELSMATKDWMADAECAGTPTDVFFPPSGENATAAKAICRACPVQTQCLDYALDMHEKHGVWGCTSEKERRQMRRRSGLEGRKAVS